MELVCRFAMWMWNGRQVRSKTITMPERRRERNEVVATADCADGAHTSIRIVYTNSTIYKTQHTQKGDLNISTYTL